MARSSVWNDSSNLGNEPIDSQHRHIIDKIEELADRLNRGENPDLVKATLDIDKALRARPEGS